MSSKASESESTGARCARCGRPINQTPSTWTPTAPGELCSWCLTGHGPAWQEAPEPTFAEAPAIAATHQEETLPAAPRPAVALTLAEGVTLVLENIGLDQLDPSHLAKLAAAGKPLLAELRRLNLVA